MTHQENDIFAKGVLNQMGPLDKSELSPALLSLSDKPKRYMYVT